MEEENNINEESSEGKMKNWLQDNLRIIISILIVILIAGGIYSYSKKNQALTTDEKGSQETITSENGSTNKDSATTQLIQQNGSQTAPVAASQETDKSLIETAAKGDSTTRLARRALANYLEKNPDSSLTAEHKIYIEDFLRKQVPNKGVKVGSSVEFSKELIQNAITKSKSLNERQLNNLHKYAVRVPSLS